MVSIENIYEDAYNCVYSLKGVLLSIETIETNRVIFVEANFVANEGMECRREKINNIQSMSLGYHKRNCLIRFNNWRR